MKIRTQLIISTAVFGAVLLIVSTSLVVTNQRVARTAQLEETARSLERSAYELGYLSNDYLLYHESQQLARWESRYASFSDDLGRLKVTTPEQQALVNDIRTNQQRLEAVFTEVRTTLDTASRTPGAVVDPRFMPVSWSRMEVQNQGMIFDASRLADLLDDEENQLKQTNSLLMSVLIWAFGIFILANYVLTYRRTLKSIAELQAGTKVVGSGNLDFTIPVKTADEVGALSRAFNRMTASLKGVTASKAELEREIAERQQAELRANRQKAIQEAINRILREALTSETDKQLGNTCLAIAQEITGSKFGFLVEVNPQGRLSDIAISDPGWEACRMPEPSGHGKLKTTLTVHGIYGRVLLDGKGFFTNDPASHPDSIGVPPGHPALTAFLGVPLTHDQKTIGVLALGNREGGYRTEDLEAAEALAPATVQALMRKRAEEALKERTLEVEASNKELEAFSYSVSHDLRAPLRSMDGFSQALLEDYAGKLDAQAREYLEYIRSSSQLMAQLIDDMLTLSRITRTEIALVKVNLSKLAQEVADEMKRLHPERRVDWAIAPGLEAYGDKYLLKLVFENLMGNAFKFTSRRAEASIEFGLSERDGAPAYFVRDNGAGFDMAYVDKLFKPFQRLHRAEEFPGTGIGLASVQRIISRLGGQVWAEGEPDKGATFSFTLRQNV